MEWEAKRYIISTFFAYFYKNKERVSCVYGVEREGLIMIMRVKDRSCDLLSYAIRLNIRR